jgi:hypothetical protein
MLENLGKVGVLNQNSNKERDKRQTRSCFQRLHFTPLVFPWWQTVVLTGAMIPLCEPVSDAKRNLIISMMVIGHAHTLHAGM